MKKLTIPEAMSILDEVSVYGTIFSPSNNLIVEDGWFIQPSGRRYLHGRLDDDLIRIIRKNRGKFRIYSARRKALSGDYSISIFNDESI